MTRTTAAIRLPTAEIALGTGGEKETSRTVVVCENGEAVPR